MGLSGVCLCIVYCWLDPDFGWQTTPSRGFFEHCLRTVGAYDKPTARRPLRGRSAA